jgi:hypothetical protein
MQKTISDLVELVFPSPAQACPAFCVRPGHGILTIALVLMVSSGNAVAFHGSQTYQLDIYPYCKPGTFCGFDSFEDLDEKVHIIVQEVNVQWAHTGISFRPNLHPVDSVSPEEEVKFCEDSRELCSTDADCGAAEACLTLADDDNYWKIGHGCAKDSVGLPLRRFWQQNESDTSESIPILLIEGVTKSDCCGGAWGVHCNAKDDGNILAHELGHFFCGSHTFQGKVKNSLGEPVGQQGYTFVDQPQYLPDGIIHHDGDGIEDTPPDPGEFEPNRLCSNVQPGQPVFQCSDDALCQMAYGPASFCDACKEFVCSDNVAINCESDSDCSASDSGSCICNPHLDEDPDGTLREGHQWCETQLLAEVDMGSPHASGCEVDCRTVVDGQAVPFGPAAKPELTMTYYRSSCTGPYVVDGVRYDVFTPGGLANIYNCQDEKFPTLVDICEGQDFDHDGVCDAEDSCPTIQNLSNQDTDTDGDGISDACDNCPAIANADQSNIDYDLEGDACDDDVDNDGCPNSVDQHPTASATKIGTVIPGPNCSFGVDETSYGFEGTTSSAQESDPDGDGVVNCMDFDDDNDGRCDDDVALAHNPVLGVPPGGCEGPDPCPRCDEEESASCALTCFRIEDCPATAWWLTCGLSSSCRQFFLLFTNAINPDPTTAVIFPQFQISDQIIYASRLPLSTSSEQALSIRTLAEQVIQPPALTEGTMPAGVRLEIWQLPSEPGTGPRLYAVIGEYGPDSIDVGALRRGDLIRIIPTVDDNGADQLYIDTTYTVGPRLDQELADQDSDTWPDFLDNCPTTPNQKQYDSDGDRIGDLCDPDLDNDCEITAADAELVSRCEGAYLAGRYDFDIEPGEDALEAGFGPPSTVEAVLAAACRGADLNGDEWVDQYDIDQVEQLVGTSVGGFCVPGAFPPFDFPGSECIHAATLDPASLTIKQLNLEAGLQNFLLRGEAVLSTSLSTESSPVENGMQMMLRTAQGRTVFDAHIPGGQYDQAT